MEISTELRANIDWVLCPLFKTDSPVSWNKNHHRCPPSKRKHPKQNTETYEEHISDIVYQGKTVEKIICLRPKAKKSAKEPEEEFQVQRFKGDKVYMWFYLSHDVSG